MLFRSIYQDMLAMFSDFTPKFVKKYAEVGQIMSNAFETFINDVKDGTFPQQEHTYKIDSSVVDELNNLI